MKPFLKQFHKLTDNKYAALRLSDISVLVRKKSIELVFLYPENTKLSEEEIKEITEKAIKALNSNAAVSVKFLKSHFDEEFAARYLFDFLKAYPALSASMEKNDIVCDKAVKKIQLLLAPVIYDYCIERKLEGDILAFLDRKYCDKIDFSIQKKQGAKEFFDEETDTTGKLIFEEDGGRTIKVDNVDALIGGHIYSRACYIEDAVKPQDSLVVCGTLVEFISKSYIDKRTNQEKPFYILTIEDMTGRIEAVYFPTKAAKDKIGLLKKGKELIVQGALEPSKRNAGQLSYLLKDICYCSLPKNLTVNRQKRAVDSHYHTVFPVPYKEEQQASLFEKVIKEDNIPVSLRNKSFVVFDLETTGLHPINDKIIEVGAIKIVDGVFTESWDTLIDPKIPIPPEITKINHISDRDVFGKPTIDKVLPDLYKFMEGCELVAHNHFKFDGPFVAAKGKEMNIYFDHEKHCTLELSRNIFPHLKRHNLGAMCEHFGIENQAAHRALSDAVATAKLFFKLSHYK